MIDEKGAKGLNRASSERGDSVVVAAGIGVHKRCHMNLHQQEANRLV